MKVEEIKDQLMTEVKTEEKVEAPSEANKLLAGQLAWYLMSKIIYMDMARNKKAIIDLSSFEHTVLPKIEELEASENMRLLREIANSQPGEELRRYVQYHTKTKKTRVKKVQAQKSTISKS